MIEIGKQEIVVVKTRNKSTGKLEPKIVNGQPEQTLREKRVFRITRNALNGHFGPDNGRRLVVGLVAPDQIVFRPQGTRQTVVLNILDCYRIAIQRRANLAVLDRARERKAAKQRQRESRAIRRADRRLTETGRAACAGGMA